MNKDEPTTAERAVLIPSSAESSAEIETAAKAVSAIAKRAPVMRVNLGNSISYRDVQEGDREYRNKFERRIRRRAHAMTNGFGMTAARIEVIKSGGTLPPVQNRIGIGLLQAREAKAAIDKLSSNSHEFARNLELDRKERRDARRLLTAKKLGLSLEQYVSEMERMTSRANQRSELRAKRRADKREAKRAAHP